MNLKVPKSKAGVREIYLDAATAAVLKKQLPQVKRWNWLQKTRNPLMSST